MVPAKVIRVMGGLALIAIASIGSANADSPDQQTIEHKIQPIGQSVAFGGKSWAKEVESELGCHFGLIDETGTGITFGMVIDGKEFTDYQPNEAPALSDDGTRFAYVGNPTFPRHSRFGVVLDGTMLSDCGEPREETLVFSHGGSHFAYVALQQDSRALVVIDKIPGPEFDDIVGAPVFSPDGRHYGYDLSIGTLPATSLRGSRCGQTVATSPDRSAPTARHAVVAHPVSGAISRSLA